MIQSTDVVLIDDSREHTETASRLLNHHGLSTSVLTDTSNILDRLESLHPRLILLDLMMPGMDGFSILRDIKSHPVLCYTPIFILTGKAFPPEEKKALNMGAEKFLTKPIPGARLVEEIQTRLGTQQ